MDIECKKEIFNQNRNKLNILINNLSINISINFKLIKDNYKLHYDFLNFIDMIKLYESYKWEKIKQEYNNIKKMITLNKNLNKLIIKLYGNINNYYTDKENNNMNNLLQKFNDDILLLKIEMNNLRNTHIILVNKKTNYIKNNNIIKIYKLHDKCIIYINKLYDMYDKINILNKQKNILKNEKKKYYIK